MNRREALIAVLTMPAAASSVFVKEKQTTSGKVRVFSNQTQLHVPLTDADKDEAGVTALVVTYSGKEVTFTAREIWDALNA